MAEILDDYEFGKVGRNDGYPYDEWFDGQVWKLYQGVDFDCGLVSMRVNLYNAARKRGIKIRTSMRVDAVILQREREG
jgi:hypothetical protein